MTLLHFCDYYGCKILLDIFYKEIDMKKITPLIFFTSLAMLVASCSPSEPDANKATIALGEVSHATTTLSAGKYELNKEIKFTVTVLEEYKLVDVRMNDSVLTPMNELSYSFTPTEVKT